MVFQYPEAVGTGSGVPQLRVEVAGDGRTVTVWVRGEVDLATADLLEAGIEFGLHTGSPSRLVVQLSQVTFFSAAGLRVLIGAHDEAAKRGVDLVLQGPSACVWTVLDLSETRDLFSTAPRAAAPE